jgi:hypothetical protein
MIFFSHKCGQLGNRLFSFAHIIAHAEAHNLKIVNLAFDEYAKYFHTTSKDIFCRYPATQSTIKPEWVRSTLFVINKIALKILRIIRAKVSPFHVILVADLPEYDFKGDKYFNLDQIRNYHFKAFVFLFGRFFRDYRNFEKYQNVIRNYFRPIKEIEDSVNGLIEKGRIDSDFLIGVHMRRGDYKFFSDGKYYYDQRQYLDKMKELKDSAPEKRIKFFICSNEQIELDHNQEFSILKGPGHLVVDMYLLAHCDFIMGPPSTYTLWASFYGNKPLHQLKDLRESITLDSFIMLPPDILFNFSFN